MSRFACWAQMRALYTTRTSRSPTGRGKNSTKFPGRQAVDQRTRGRGVRRGRARSTDASVYATAGLLNSTAASPGRVGWSAHACAKTLARRLDASVASDAQPRSSPLWTESAARGHTHRSTRLPAARLDCTLASRKAASDPGSATARRALQACPAFQILLIRSSCSNVQLEPPCLAQHQIALRVAPRSPTAWMRAVHA